MKLSEKLVIRHVGSYTHILNPFTGRIVSLQKSDFEDLYHTEEQNIDTDIIDAIKIPTITMMNSRLFRRELIELGGAYNFPTIVNIEITRRCVLDCIHCYISQADHKGRKIKGLESLNSNDIDILIKDLFDLGVFLIVLTGGEPLISKNYDHFVTACEKYGILFEIFSSLQFLPRETNKNLARVQTSVYSLSAGIHESITRIPGSLKRTLSNIRKLKNIGVYVEVATPLMKLNFDDRHKISKYFADNGIKQNFSWPILNEYYSEKTNKSLLNITKEEFREFCNENPDFVIDCVWNDEKDPICEAGVSVFAISADGNVFPCSQYPISVGNIFKDKLKKIYSGEKMQKAVGYKVKDLPKSKKYFNYCIGNNYSETGDPLKQPTFMTKSLKYVMEHSDRKGGNLK